MKPRSGNTQEKIQEKIQDKNQEKIQENQRENPGGDPRLTLTEAAYRVLRDSLEGRVWGSGEKLLELFPREFEDLQPALRESLRDAIRVTAGLAENATLRLVEEHLRENSRNRPVWTDTEPTLH